MAGWVDIDAGIAPLVEALNGVPGIVTTVSCEGHPESPHDKRAYVGFTIAGCSVELRVWPEDIGRVAEAVAGLSTV
jgi:hypothetical protein